MAVVRRFRLVLAVMILPIFLFGCGEEGGSGAVEPLADEPMILESVMCLDIDDARPVGITDTFLESDKNIYIWMYWTNVEDSSSVKAAWFEPGKDFPFREDSQIIDSVTGFQIIWFYIEKPSDGFIEGEWSVDIYLNGLFERSYLFMVEP